MELEKLLDQLSVLVKESLEEPSAKINIFLQEYKTFSHIWHGVHYSNPDVTWCYNFSYVGEVYQSKVDLADNSKI